MELYTKKGELVHFKFFLGYWPEKLPITKAAIKRASKAWYEEPYGLLVPPIAKFEAREICQNTELVFDVVSFWHEEYLICNRTAFDALYVFRNFEFNTQPTPIMFFS